MPLEPVWLSGQSILQVHLYVCVHDVHVCICMYCTYVCECVCGHISACKHVAGSEEQWCIHYHQSQPRASPALMAAIIKKAFRGGCATKGGKVGATLGWLVAQSEECRTAACQKTGQFCTGILQRWQK